MIRLCILFSIFSCSLFSLPEASRTVHGKSKILPIGSNRLQVQADDMTIIEWNDFCISDKESVHFILPSSDSCVLNQIKGSDMTIIEGRIRSNGKVIMINPHGIFFEESAKVQTAAFIASTLRLTNEDFLTQEDWTFSGSSNAIIENEGTIIALKGDILLIAYDVENEGRIDAKGGKIELIRSNHHLIINSDDASSKPHLPSWGEIQGSIQQSHENFYSLALRHAETPDALEIIHNNGRFLLQIPSE